MNSTIFTVYWMHKGLHPNALQYTDMKAALAFIETLRREAAEKQYSAITMSSETANQVGRLGVDSVVDGRTPDGEIYDWNKNYSIGKMRLWNRIPRAGTDFVRVPVDE